MLRRYPSVTDHMGALGTQLVYDAERDLYVVVSVASDGAIPTSVRLLTIVLGAAIRLDDRQ